MIYGQSRNTLNAAAYPPGAQMLRLHDGGCRWSLIEKSQGQYDFSKLDQHLAASEAHGAGSLYTFCSTPPWCGIPVPNAPASIMEPGTNLPPHLPDWTDFVIAIVKHVRRADGSLRIKQWELWNEPNYTGFWCGSNTQLLAMAKVLYVIVKAYDPSARVTSPSPAYSWSANTAVTAMNEYLAMGFQNYCDILSFHGYCKDNDPAKSIGPTLDALRDLRTKYGVPNMPLWDTEWGFKLNTDCPDSQKAQFVTDGLQIRLDKAIGAAVWYQADNVTHGTQILKTGELTVAGSAWMHFVQGHTSTQREEQL
jgi:hypothetical protein